MALLYFSALRLLAPSVMFCGLELRFPGGLGHSGWVYG
jgi:hypothetical protein